MTSYAIVSIGGKQYRVREGERLLVDRVAGVDAGKTFNPQVLLIGGNGDAEYAPKGAQVTIKVLGEAKGDKIRIGKYKAKSGYKRHTGFRASLSQIEVQSIGAKAKSKPKAETAEEKPKAAAKPKTAAKPKATTTKKPAAAKPKAATRKKASDGA